MKKTVVILLLFSIVISMAFTFTGCSQLSEDEAYTQLQNAITNTLSDDNGHIFYWKEAYATPRSGMSNLVDATRVNVLCEIDRDYNFVKASEAEYDYADLKVNVVHSFDGVDDDVIYCGVAQDGVSHYARTDCTKNAKGEYVYQEFADMTARDYVLSEQFKPYTLETKLGELMDIQQSDLIFEGVKNGGTEKKGNVVTITCKMSDDYLARYKAEKGKDSVLDGAYVVFETAYERVSAIIVYAASEDGGLLKMEYESYKFELVYTGPKFTVPSKA